MQVALHGSSLVRCLLPLDTWDLLWEVRTSIRAMLRRNLSGAGEDPVRDGRLISLLVRLLNETPAGPARDGDVD